MDRVLNIAGIIIMLLIMAFGVFVYAAPHFGWWVDGLRTGSMAPTLNRGTLVVGQPVRPKEIALGDIIIFRALPTDKNLLCHRVVEIEESPLQFRTRGDALPNPDPDWVLATAVEARVVFHAEIIGYAAMFMKTATGLLITLGVPGLFIIAICLRGIKQELPAARRKKDRQNG
jgi:signal peptidase I